MYTISVTNSAILKHENCSLGNKTRKKIQIAKYFQSAQIIKSCKFAKINQVGNTAYKTGCRLPPFHNVMSCWPLYYFRLEKFHMMSDVLKRLQTLKVFFRLLLKYVILLQVWKLYVIQCLPNGIAKMFKDGVRAFWPLFGKQVKRPKRRLTR